MNESDVPSEDVMFVMTPGPKCTELPRCEKPEPKTVTDVPTPPDVGYKLLIFARLRVIVLCVKRLFLYVVNLMEYIFKMELSIAHQRNILNVLVNYMMIDHFYIKWIMQTLLILTQNVIGK